MTSICSDDLEQLKDDLKSGKFKGYRYVNIEDLEDDYSHTEIYDGKDEFIYYANKYFEENNLPYIMRDMFQSAMVADKQTKEVFR